MRGFFATLRMTSKKKATTTAATLGPRRLLARWMEHPAFWADWRRKDNGEGKDNGKDKGKAKTKAKARQMRGFFAPLRMTSKKKCSDNSNAVGREAVYIPPIANARWMGHPFCWCCPTEERSQQQIPFGGSRPFRRWQQTAKATANASFEFCKVLPFCCGGSFCGKGFYLGMSVKLWMETFAPPRARSLAGRKTMVTASNWCMVLDLEMGNRSVSFTG
jgi:hypothetical protein